MGHGCNLQQGTEEQYPWLSSLLSRCQGTPLPARPTEWREPDPLPIRKGSLIVRKGAVSGFCPQMWGEVEREPPVLLGGRGHIDGG